MIFARLSKEYQSKGLTADSSLKEYENKVVAKSTLRVQAKEYQNKGLKRFCAHCGVAARSLGGETCGLSLPFLTFLVKSVRKRSVCPAVSSRGFVG